MQIHTSHLKQWAVVMGKNVQLMTRPERPGQKYTRPIPAGKLRFNTKAEAKAFKQTYDLSKHTIVSRENMTEVKTRKQLRLARQAKNRESLTPEQVKKHKKAAGQFILFGGKHGSKSVGRTFEQFVEIHGTAV